MIQTHEYGHHNYRFIDTKTTDIEQTSYVLKFRPINEFILDEILDEQISLCQLLLEIYVFRPKRQEQ